MNKWQEHIDVCKAALEETQEWSKENWKSLPDGVKKVIVRGEMYLEEKMEVLEERAKKEGDLAEWLKLNAEKEQSKDREIGRKCSRKCKS